MSCIQLALFARLVLWNSIFLTLFSLAFLDVGCPPTSRTSCSLHLSFRNLPTHHCIQYSKSLFRPYCTKDIDLRYSQSKNSYAYALLQYSPCDKTRGRSRGHTVYQCEADGLEICKSVPTDFQEPSLISDFVILSSRSGISLHPSTSLFLLLLRVISNQLLTMFVIMN